MATLLTQQYNLNLIPGQNIVVVNAAAYDNSPRLIRFNMFNGAVAADISGWSARVEGTRQGTKAGFSTVCTVASPVVSFAITNAMTASSGKHQAAVVFYQGEERVASATFILNVAPAVLDESTPATEEDATIYQQWLAANTSQIQTNANDIAVLKGRMDEFASLPDGSTTGDAELVDIRVGADGTTYPTAGDAVRNQVTNLKTAIKNNLNTQQENLTYEQGGIAVSGSAIQSSQRIRTVRLLPDNILGVYAPAGMSINVYAFENDTYIGRYVGANTFSSSAADVTASVKDALFAEMGGHLTYRYKIVLYKDDESNIIPSDAESMIYYLATDKTLSVPEKAADAKAVGDAIADITQQVGLLFEPFSETIVNYNEYPIKTAIIDASKRWRISTDYKSAFIRVPVGTNKQLSVLGNSANTAYISILTSDAIGANNTSVTTWATGYSGRLQISPATSYAYDLPSDCNYILVHYNTRGSDLSPKITITCNASTEFLNSERITALENKSAAEDVITVGDADVERAIALNSQGHDIPQNRGILNAYKKTRQMSDMPWTALSAIPGRTASNAIAAGAHIGLPYSSVKEYNKYVGLNVSFRTFMTAAHNPYSLLYTEDVLGSRSRSAYGISYHGSNCGAYFGIVCSVLTGYALGWKEYWSTEEFAYLCESGKLKKALDQSAYGLRRGDMIWEPGHVNIIIDIARDDDGTPTHIYWAESISYFPKIHDYSVAQVNERLADRGGIIYYDPNIYGNTEYTPSPFVGVGSEYPSGYTYNDDICTYAGDYACFNSGEDVYINYTAGSYIQMEIYKDDVLLSTIDLDTSVHAVKITTSGYGMYKARLKNGTNYSDFTYFEIVDTTVTCDYSDGTLLVYFSSANGSPKYAQITYRDGTSCGVVPFTANDISNGNILIKPYDVLKEQHGDSAFSETAYIKVFFEGDYGVVVNPYLSISGL